MNMHDYLRSMQQSGDSQQVILSDFLLDVIEQDGEEHAIGCAQIVAEEALAFVKKFSRAQGSEEKE